MIDTLCFSSGGFYGLFFISSLKYLIDINYFDLNNITTFVGTSIGAAISFLLVIGYTPEELYVFFKNYDFKNLELDIDLLSLEKNLENFGLDNCKNGIDLIIFLFERKLKLKLDNITLKDLYVLTKKKFILNATNFNKGGEVLFSYESHPDILVLQVLRMTVSIPVIYTPVLYKNEYYLDGALCNDILLSLCNPKTTLGFYIENVTEFELNSLQDLILGSLTILANKNKMNYDNYNIIKFKKTNTKIISLGVTNKNIDDILLSGIKITKRFILNEMKLNIQNKTNNIIKDIIGNIISKIENNIIYNK
jgi:predicted acylesterase/phospholipase RssA